ncbi:MAG: hypothetical protein ACRBDI_07015 [Alphaproteobacteria bacterium]
MLKIILASAIFMSFAASTLAQAGFLDDLGGALDNAAKDLEQAIDGDVAEEEQEQEQAVAPAETLKSLDVVEGDLWHEARFQWGQIYDPKTVKYIKADVTCDGHMDYVAHRLNEDNPDGPFYNIMVVTREGGNLTSEGVSLSFDSTRQDALCGSAHVAVSVEHWDEGQIDAAMGGWEGICTEAIRVDDNMCDAPRYFWRTNLSPEDNHPRLMFFRN